MNAIFQDHQDSANPMNGARVEADEAHQLLGRLRNCTPFFCSLEAQGGTLLIGVGGDVGCVQFTAAGGGPPYLMARNAGPADHLRKIEYREFLTGGTPTPVHQRYHLPWSEIEKVVNLFLEHGALAPDLVWEEI